MRPRTGRYFWKLFLANAILIALVVSVCVWIILAQAERFRQRELSRSLFTQAVALNAAIGEKLAPEHAPELQALAREIGQTAPKGVRVTFVLANGVVLGDSQANPAQMESHADRPEIIAALADGSGESTRWSHTVSQDMKYVALRVGPANAPLGVVRVSMPVRDIEETEAPVRRLAGIVTAVSVLSAVLLALALAQIWSRRIRVVTDAAGSLAGGDLDARIAVVGNDEVAALAQSLNDMRERIAAQLGTIDRQRRTLDALVEQLREGVVVADATGHILLVNAEAIDLLHLVSLSGGAEYVGRTVEQCVPQPRLQRLLAPQNYDLSDSAERVPPDELELRVEGESGFRTILARAFDIRLPDMPGALGHEKPATGRALILTDITELTRIMNMKADLAANASHELRTPIAAIRAAVDTLRSEDLPTGATNLAGLLAIVDRHSARLESMVGDLLELSRLESGVARFPKSETDVEHLLDDMAEAARERATAKQIDLNVSVEDDVRRITTSPELLRMVLRNLIDNAVRFSKDGGEVDVGVRASDGNAVFAVKDRGCGIAAEDQKRVFERFYQTQRSRSGSDRGTGLGLSIVRHAVSALGGSIKLDSALGRGTTVSVTIPIRAENRPPDNHPGSG